MHVESPWPQEAPTAERQFEELYRRWHGPVVHACRRYLGHRDAEAVAQEAFLRAWMSFDSLAEGRPFGPWVVTIARRLSLNELRRDARRGHESTAETLPEDLVAPQSDDFDRLLGADAMARALKRLSPRQQRLLRLHHAEGWSYGEIARLEGVSGDSVKGSLKRARIVFRRLYEGVGDSRLAGAGAAAGLIRLRFRLTRAVDRLCAVVAPRWANAELALAGALTALLAGGLPGAAPPQPTAASAAHADLRPGSAPPTTAVDGPSTAAPGPRPSASSQRPAGDHAPVVAERPFDVATGSNYEFTASPSYEQDHTVFATAMVGAPCGNACRVLLKSVDGGATWSRTGAEGTAVGRVLLPPAFPRDRRIFTISNHMLWMSEDDGSTFGPLVAVPGPASMSPQFSSGDPRILFAVPHDIVTPMVATEYRHDDRLVAPVDLPLPPGTMPLWFSFGPDYDADRRVFVVSHRIEEEGRSDALVRLQPLDRFLRVHACTPESCELTYEQRSAHIPSLTWSPTGAAFAWTAFTFDRSVDGGRSFTPLPGPAHDRRVLRDLDIGPDGSVYATMAVAGSTYGELHVSRDQGETWTLLTQRSELLGDVVVLPDGAMLTSAQGTGIRCSVDGGRTWTEGCPAR